MMHEGEKSDPAVRARKSANKADEAAESMEQRAGAKGKAIASTTNRTQSRASVSPGLDRLRQRARENRNEKFTALLHHITVDLLTQAYHWLKRDAAAGVDGVTWQAYGTDLQANLADLHGRVHRGAYRAQPSRRRMIPKADGRERPLGIASLEDKIVQRAVVEVLNAIYEPEFLGFSYGFRPGRSQHDALDALWVGIDKTRINWIFDADIRSFLDPCLHCPLVYDVRSNRPGFALETFILKPFRLPSWRSTASSSPRFTRCNTVCRVTPRSFVASCIAR